MSAPPETVDDIYLQVTPWSVRQENSCVYLLFGEDVSLNMTRLTRLARRGKFVDTLEYW